MCINRRCPRTAPCREALAAAPPGGGSEAEHLAKEAMRVGVSAFQWNAVVTVNKGGRARVCIGWLPPGPPCSCPHCSPTDRPAAAPIVARPTRRHLHAPSTPPTALLGPAGAHLPPRPVRAHAQRRHVSAACRHPARRRPPAVSRSQVASHRAGRRFAARSAACQPGGRLAPALRGVSKTCAAPPGAAGTDPGGLPAGARARLLPGLGSLVSASGVS